MEFTTETPTLGKEAIRDEVLKNIEEQRLKETAEKLHIPLEQVRQAFRERAGDWERLARDLQKLKPDDDCNDGEHCQRLYDERELPQLLASGWKVVCALPSGRIVLTNE